MSHETRPESPQENSTGVTTPTGAPERGSSALGPVSGAFPDVRLWPDGVVTVHGTGEWVGTVVAVRRDQDGFVCAPPSPPDYYREASAEAQRMVPVGPLRELAKRIDDMAHGADERAREASTRKHGLNNYNFWAGMATAREQCAKDLRDRLASLLGETTTGEGS